MAAFKKGTVTSLSSVFPAEEARKAAQRVEEAIAEKHKELDNLQHFVDDNTNLINLVQRLPDELHHNIMVPFGKHAFFPGRLVHTNEFMVLLGEGYFAERTAKQTVDILKRRGNTLDSEVDAVKAVIDDLRTEVSFFDRTAAEAAEGLVEIREDLSDGDEDFKDHMIISDEENSNVSNASQVPARSIDDEEYARIMSRLDELEKEELEAEEHEDDNLDEDANNLNLNGQTCSREELSGITSAKKNDGNISSKPKHRDESTYNKELPKTHAEKSTVKDHVPPVMKSSIQTDFKSHSEISAPMSKPDGGSQMYRPEADSLKAFTGSIIERADNLQPNLEKNSQPSNSQPAKPVSRFKMQRRAA